VQFILFSIYNTKIKKEIKWKNTLGTKFTAISSLRLTPHQDGVTAAVSSIKPLSTLEAMPTLPT
jgi:hypothetical protein